MNEEDEAFNEMEKQSMWRKRAVQAAISTNPYRNQVIEEVALEVEKLTGFGKDTIDSLAIYIREMKKWQKHKKCLKHWCLLEATQHLSKLKVDTSIQAYKPVGTTF